MLKLAKMYKFVGVCIFLFIVCRTSAEFTLEYGNWSPILGRCLTCERGRLISLQRNSKHLHQDLSVGESRNLHSQSSANKFSLVPANVYPLEIKDPVERDTNRVQLVYLPEGSINDLRSARLVKVKEGVGRIQLRQARAVSHPSDVFQNAPLDLETSGSTVSFREISPRRPTALIAERGREREAREQIQLLEAALNSRPNNVQAGELPRVFIAPTHLAPPPGYVKIPLLPSENHVESKKILPGTFLTSEVHRQLPPGFVQVPLPERVAVLSHSIPFVNPETNVHLQSQNTNQGRQQSIQQIDEAQNFIGGDQRRGQFRQQQNVNTRDPIQENREQQVIKAEPIQEQHFGRGQTKSLDRGQLRHVGLRGQSLQPQQSQPDFNRQPVQQGFNRGQLEPQDFHRGGGAQPTRGQLAGQQQRNEVSPVGQLSPPRKEEQPTSEIIPSTEGHSTTGQSPFRNEPDPFGDYAPNSFDDYAFSLPDYEQLFDAYDNADFNIPNEPETVTPLSTTKLPPTSTQVAHLTKETEQAIQSDQIEAVTEFISSTEIPVSQTPVVETTVKTEQTFSNIAFKLSPRPLQTIPTLSPRPVEAFTDNSKNVATDIPDVAQSVTNSPANIQLSPKPLDLIGIPVVQSVQDKSVRAQSRRRRPINSENRGRHRLNLRTTESPITEQSVAIPNQRTRSNINILRRRPEPSTTEANILDTTTVTPTSTLFPPFAVAKKIHETTEAPAVKQQQPVTRRRDGSLSRGRFGSRLRSRAQVLGENDNAQVIASNNLATDQGQTQGSQRRRTRTRGRGRRLRGPNGRPLGKRRRVLSRVRKINPEAQHNGLNAENELRVAESARVSFSRSPVVQVADPIAQTLKLIGSNGETPTDSTKAKLALDEIPVQQNNEQPPTDNGEDIFHLLNFDNLKQANEASTAGQKEKSIESSSSSARLSTEGYVNNGESISETKIAFVEPVDVETASHGRTPVQPLASEANSESSSSSFDSVNNFISNIPSSSIDAIAPTPVALTSNELSQNKLKHLTPESTIVAKIDETLPNTFDKFDNTFGTFSPEDAPSEDNGYNDYDNEQTDANNTYVGSSAHIVYAVALSDEPLPESSTSVPETTMEPLEQEISITATEPNLSEIDFEDQHVLSSAADIETINVNLVTDKPEDTTTYFEQVDNDTINVAAIQEPAEPDTKSVNDIPSKEDKSLSAEPTSKAANPKVESEPNSLIEPQALLVPNLESEAKSELNQQVKSGAESETEPQSEPEPEPEPQSEPEPKLSDDLETKLDSLTTPESFQDDEAELSDSFITTELNIEETTTPLTIDEQTTQSTPSNQLFPTNKPETKLPKDKPVRKTLAEALAERLKASKLTTTTLPPTNFLESFFSRTSKNTADEVTNTDERVIGKSTVTEVRASQPVVCIDGNCVNVVGGGVRKR